MTAISLEQAEVIVEATLRKGRELNLAPLTVAVLDPGGHLVMLKREDGSGIMRVEVATGKAWGSLGMGFNSREFADRFLRQPAFITALGNASNGRMLPAPGGVLILDADKKVIGAVGISGDTSDNDEICGFAGISAAGLAAYGK